MVKKKKRNLQSWKVTNIITNHGNTHTDSDKTPPLDALRQASLTEGERQHFYLTIINRAWKRNPVKQWNRLVWPSGSEGKASSSFTDARVTRGFHMVTLCHSFLPSFWGQSCKVQSSRTRNHLPNPLRLTLRGGDGAQFFGGQAGSLETLPYQGYLLSLSVLVNTPQ